MALGLTSRRGYAELLDLATERNNKEIIQMLRDYDIQDVYLKRQKVLKEDSFSESDSDDSRDGSRGTMRRQMPRGKQVAVKPGELLRAVAAQALMMKGKPGNWTGIKGVRVMKAAIAAGVPLDLVDSLAPHLSNILSLIDFLRRAVYDLVDPKSQARRLGGRRDKSGDDSTPIELPASRGRRPGGELPLSPGENESTDGRQSPSRQGPARRPSRPSDTYDTTRG